MKTKLPHAIKDELAFCAFLMPLARADLKLQIDTTIVATDATPQSGGACDAVAPTIIAENLYTCAAEHNGEHVRFGDDHIFESVFLPTRMTPLNEELEVLIEGFAWRGLGGYRFNRTEHIDIQEFAALKNELKRLVSRRGIVRGRRVVLVDSRVVVGAWAKGRSSSRRLSRSLRGAIGWSVLGLCKLKVVWVNTKVNPADDVSRFVLLVTPKILPPWGVPFFERDSGGELVQYSLGERGVLDFGGDDRDV